MIEELIKKYVVLKDSTKDKKAKMLYLDFIADLRVLQLRTKKHLLESLAVKVV